MDAERGAETHFAGANNDGRTDDNGKQWDKAGCVIKKRVGNPSIFRRSLVQDRSRSFVILLRKIRASKINNREASFELGEARGEIFKRSNPPLRDINGGKGVLTLETRGEIF